MTTTDLGEEMTSEHIGEHGSSGADAPASTWPSRRFGARAAALAGLLVTVAVPTADARGGAGNENETEIVVAGVHPDPSTCCGREP
jgi:hypothetical protein